MITLSKTICRILLFTFSFQAIMPAYASFIEADINLTSQLDYQPGIISGHVNSPYIPSQAINLSAPDTIDIDTFYQTLIDGQPLSINAPLGVMVGNSAVQAHVIRAQIQRLTGRSILTTVTDATNITEASQIQQLYQDAAHYLNHQLTQGHALKFGDRLNQDPRDFDYEHPIIWPEYRNISGYNNILVPIVYLPKSTYDHFNIASNVVEASGTTTVESLTINDATIRFGQDAYLAVTHDLINNGGTIRGEEGLRITTGGQLQNLSGIISANDDLIIGANSINNSTLLYHYDTAAGTQSTFGEIARIDSDNGNLVIRSAGDIIFEGATASAPEGELTLASDGSIYLGPLSLYNSDQSRFGSGTSTTNVLSFLQSSLTAKDTLTLIASGQILIDAAKIISTEGHIELLSQLGISIINELETTQTSAEGSFGKRDVTESVYQTVAIRSLLDAGKGIKLHSAFGDITLKSTNINSSEGTKVKASNGGVNLLMTTETDHYAYSSIKKGLFTTQTENMGHNIETGVANTIVGGITVEALNGVTVEYEGLSGLDCVDFLSTLSEVPLHNENDCLRANILKLSEMPGMEWMADILALADADPVAYNWNEIALQYKTWRENKTSLSPALAAVIAITVAIVAGPAGTAAASSITGASTAAVAAGTAGSLATAISAGTVALISQASVAFANGAVNGDIPGAMSDFASEETLKSLAVSMVTAGAIAELDAAFFDVDTQSVNGLLDAGPVNPETIQLAKETATQSLGLQIAEAVTHAAVQAGVEVAIQGGSFEEVFVDSLAMDSINKIGEKIASAIGEASKPSFDASGQIVPPEISQVTRYIAHAASSCLVGSLTAKVNHNDVESACAAGAGGAVVGEVIGDLYVYAHREEVESIENLLQEEIEYLQTYGIDSEDRQAILESLRADSAYYHGRLNDLYENGVDLARFGSALGAFLAGTDAENVTIAANTGETAAANNALPALFWGALFITSAVGTYLTALELKDTGEKIIAADSEGNTQLRNELLEECTLPTAVPNIDRII